MLIGESQLVEVEPELHPAHLSAGDANAGKAQQLLLRANNAGNPVTSIELNDGFPITGTGIAYRYLSRCRSVRCDCNGKFLISKACVGKAVSEWAQRAQIRLPVAVRVQ